MFDRNSRTAGKALPNNLSVDTIREVFIQLEAIRKRFIALDREFSLRIPLRDVEQRWGEYFVANGLLGVGIDVTLMQRRGVDIVTDRGGVEVKTSRRTRRFKRGRIGYGWAVEALALLLLVVHFYAIL